MADSKLSGLGAYAVFATDDLLYISDISEADADKSKYITVGTIDSRYLLKAGDTITGDLTFSGAFHPVIAPGSDTDANLLEVTVTGTPTIFWDESEDAFATTHGLRVEGATVFNDGSADVDFRIESNGYTDLLFINAGTDRVGIRTTGPIARMSIDQTSPTGALPVMSLSQADISEEFIRFIGTAAAAVLTQSIVDEGDQASETREGWLKVYVQDDGNQITDQAYFIPIYTLSA